MVERDPGEVDKRVQNLTEKLLAVFEELDFLHSMAAFLARPSEVADLDGYLVRETASIFRADGGWLARRGAGSELRSAAHHGFPAAVTEFLNERFLVPLIREDSLPVLVDDLASALQQRGAARPDAPSPADFPRAFLACPLVANTEVLGAIVLGKKSRGDVFTAGDQKLLTTLAVQAALFIKNATLLRQLEAEAQSLGKRVERLESDTGSRPDLTWIRSESPTMRRLADQVEGAAATGATVLLLGESGTGKSLVARVLHRASPRRLGPFVEINCGAIPAGLIESELFGHARGAFTGANRERPGLFEEAHGGTILLDEVAELPLELQVKLLSVIEQHRVRRVGENRDRPVDVRIVAATNADLTAAVRTGRFREDLYYRLNVITLSVPPLRQRREDILPLARRFLSELARDTHRKIAGLSPAAEEALLAHAWPGNVRELRNVVERSLLLKGAGTTIELRDLPPLEGPSRRERAGELPAEPLPEAIRGYERSLIVAALDRSGGVVARAADLLGISRTNLHNKLAKHGLLKSQTWGDGSHEE